MLSATAPVPIGPHDGKPAVVSWGQPVDEDQCIYADISKGSRLVKSFFLSLFRARGRENRRAFVANMYGRGCVHGAMSSDEWLGAMITARQTVEGHLPRRSAVFVDKARVQSWEGCGEQLRMKGDGSTI